MNEQMMKNLKKQTFWQRLTAFFMGGIFAVALISALILVPKANTVLTDTTATLEEADQAIQDLAKTTSQLARIDFEGLVNDTQNLVNDSSEGITQALEKLDKIDIESLNNAISGLESVVKPLAKLFGH